MRVCWSRLIRFQAPDGRILHGEPILPHKDFDLGTITDADNLKAKVLIGDDPFDVNGNTYLSDDIAHVKKILCPLVPSEIPILRCVGLNYLKHSTLQLRGGASFM